MNKIGLDEMQIQRKNKIGNQSFLLILYLLLFDAGLYGFGFRWISYPANIMLIITFCSAIYVFRLIKGNAYAGPSPDKEKPITKVLLNVIIAVFVAFIMIVLLKNAGFSHSSNIDDMSAPILFISAAIAIMIAVITMIIKKIQNRDNE